MKKKGTEITSKEIKNIIAKKNFKEQLKHHYRLAVNPKSKKGLEIFTLFLAYSYLIYAAIAIGYILVNGIFIWQGLQFWSTAIYIFIEVLIGLSLIKNDKMILLLTVLITQFVI